MRKSIVSKWIYRILAFVGVGLVGFAFGRLFPVPYAEKEQTAKVIVYRSDETTTDETSSDEEPSDDTSTDDPSSVSFVQQEKPTSNPTKRTTTTSGSYAGKKVKTTQKTTSEDPSYYLDSNGRINLNTATAEQLTTVKGIGEAFADRIITYREQIGGFSSVDDLLGVKGVGEKRLAQWKPYFTVN